MSKNPDAIRTNQLIFAFVLFKFGLHLYTNTFAGYEIFRDELYLYACSLRPALGYVDQPPLSIWVLSLIDAFFGNSVFTIRFFSALFGALALIPIALSVKALGGNKLAIAIASLAFIVSPIYLGYSSYYSMNSIDLILWNTAILCLLKLKQSQKPIWWIYLGITMGVALLNKIGMLWFGTGLLVALILTKERRWLASRWPYVTAGIALILFSPYLIWNASQGWPTVEFLGSTGAKYSTQSIGTFLSGQFLIQNPVTVPVWLSGIIFFLVVDRKREGDLLFIIFLTILSILLLQGHAKPEYLATIFTALFIGGSVAIEKWTTSRRWIAYLVIANLSLGVFVAPMAMPILPVRSYIAYAKTLGIGPSTAEGHELSELPQFYADMFGWENQAKAISNAYWSLSDEERQKCAIFGDNYGRSGAIDYYADKYNLPLSIGSHNNYWLWGPSSYDGQLLLLCSNDFGDKGALFEEVIEMGTVYSEYAIPYENNLKVYLCKSLREPVESFWPKIKSYN